MNKLSVNHFIRVYLALAFCTLLGCASAEPLKQTRASVTPHRNHQAQQCLALAIYWEARGEGPKGMLAVGSVVLNRMTHEGFPNTACGVVREGGESPPCQFSWWCDGKSDRPTDQPQWQKSLGMADQLLAARPNDPTQGALFFHNTTISTPWLRKRTRTTQIGQHIFYR